MKAMLVQVHIRCSGPVLIANFDLSYVSYFAYSTFCSPLKYLYHMSVGTIVVTMCSRFQLVKTSLEVRDAPKESTAQITK